MRRNGGFKSVFRLLGDFVYSQKVGSNYVESGKRGFCSVGANLVTFECF
jgi:hypothetical protein